MPNRDIPDRLSPDQISGTWCMTAESVVLLKLDGLGARQEGELIMWKFHGDPDLWEFVEYTRKLEHRAPS
jgi:hypothetical protein